MSQSIYKIKLETTCYMLSQNIPDIIDNSLAKLLNLSKWYCCLIDSNASMAPQKLLSIKISIALFMGMKLKKNLLWNYWANLNQTLLKWSRTIKEISIFSNSSHLEWRAGLSDTILKGNHPGTIPAKFGLIWFSGFRDNGHKTGVVDPRIKIWREFKNIIILHWNDTFTWILVQLS